ncbi:MAG: porin family protein [Pseudomonadota bacterium]
MSKYKILSGIALMGFAPAFADQSDFYAELGYARYGIDVSEQDFDPGAIQARAGYMIWPQIGIELEAAAGAHESSLSSGDTRLGVKIDQALAGYLVGRWPVSERIDLVGRAGYQKLDVSVTGEQTGQPTVRQNGDGEGVVFGGGLEYQFDAFGVRADYTWSSEASPFPASDRIETLSISLTRAF